MKLLWVKAGRLEGRDHTCGCCYNAGNERLISTLDSQVRLFLQGTGALINFSERLS